MIYDNRLLKSDHLIVSFSFMTSHRPNTLIHEPHLVTDFSKLNYTDLADYIFNYDFSVCLYTYDVEVAWNHLRFILHDAISQFAPKVMLKPRKNSPKWFNSGVRHQLNRTRHFRKNAKIHPTTANVNRLVREENYLHQLMSTSKINYKASLVEEFAYSNSSKIYKYINNLLKRGNLPETMHLESQLASSDLDKASLFNQFFKSVYTTSEKESNASQLLSSSPCANLFNDIQVTEQEVLTALCNLNPDKASGLDSIGPKILKNCCQGLYKVLHHIFCISLHTCSIPSEWKLHCIVPIYKTGDKCSVSNYRPISLLSSVSKVLEKLVYDKLYNYLCCKISNLQFGFLRNHSSVQQLLCFIHEVTTALDSKAQVDAIYLDFKKAFDKVSHNGLLAKLKSLGVDGNAWKWIREYLSNRKQMVTVNGNHSSIVSVTSGVPQGSILGPLLFLVFINDLPDCVEFSKVHLFADDTKCSRVIYCGEDVNKLQWDIDKILTWSNRWSLYFNESKSIQMNFCSSRQPAQPSTYTLAGSCIKYSLINKDLGLLVQSDLKWEAHYNSISAKAYKMLGLLKRTFSSTNSSDTKKQLYLFLVRSQLSYGSQLWRPMLLKDILSLEKIQRRATKFILPQTTSPMTYKERLVYLTPTYVPP